MTDIIPSAPPLYEEEISVYNNKNLNNINSIGTDTDTDSDDDDIYGFNLNKCVVNNNFKHPRRLSLFNTNNNTDLYDINNKQLRDVQADVVDENTYVEFLSNEIIFFGDGSLKCQEIINHKNAEFILGINPSAKNLGILAKAKFENKDFEDVAYFEPYYLKDFVTGKKKA